MNAIQQAIIIFHQLQHIDGAFPVVFLICHSQQNQQTQALKTPANKDGDSQVDLPSKLLGDLKNLLEGAILGPDVRATFCLTTAQLLCLSLFSRTLAGRKVGNI